MLLDFQTVMEQFLDLERQVLSAFLVRPGAPPPTVTARPPADARPPEPQPLPESPHPQAAAPRPIRGVPRPVPRPATGPRASIAHGHAILITDDGCGVCARLAERLRREGRRVAIVATIETAKPTKDVYVSSLETPAEVQRLVESIASACGPIGALVHLLPLSPAPALDDLGVVEWARRLSLETRSLFLLSRALLASLQSAAAEGSTLVAATALGGSFACDWNSVGDVGFPGQGGVTGFMKCLALEVPGTRVRTVDLDRSEPVDALAEHVFQELWLTDAEPEIGYRRGVRVGLELVDVPPTLHADFAIPSDAVVLATGGARGITADVCLELARRYQPTFVIVGQSPLPPPLEPDDIRHLTAPSEVKRALTNRLRTGHSQVTPAMVERAYQQVVKDREIRDTLGLLIAAGSRAHYVALDVRDEESFAALIDSTYDVYGRIDGVIHGAGIIEDKLVRDKTIESFDRVFSTKTASAFVLAKRLRPESLRFAVFFTSIAGRFGNRGQADYAAANEVVNKLAGALNRRWPARVCAINWAPWDKRGMVSPELRREFARRGVELLPTTDGRRAFWEEIQQPASSPAEIVIGGASGLTLARPQPAAVVSSPLLKHATREGAGGSTVQYARVLDPAVDCYLRDHRLDGQPVLPLAIATELMAEAAQAAWPDLTVVAVRNLRLLKGITLEKASVRTIVTVRPPIHSREDGCTEADVDISTPGSTPPLRYRAIVELAPQLPVAPASDVSVGQLARFPLTLENAYRQWTFHGPLFQRLTAIDGIGPAGIIGRMHSPSEGPSVAGVARAGWLIDPFIFDAALQLLLMWSRAQNDKTALPSRFAAFRRFAPLSDTPLTAFVHVESSAGGHALKSDVWFVDGQGRVRACLEGMEASCSAALNRLALVGEDKASA